jgi:hypothetical protein
MRLLAVHARLARPDLLANEVTGGDQIGVLRTPSAARVARGKFGRMCTYLKAIIHLVSRLSLKAGHIPTSHERSRSPHSMGVLRTPGNAVSLVRASFVSYHRTRRS